MTSGISMYLRTMEGVSDSKRFGQQPPPNRHCSRSLIYVGRGLLHCWSAFGSRSK